jgi:hypothetical protein
MLFTVGPNKLEGFVLGKPLRPSLLFADKASPRVEHMHLQILDLAGKACHGQTLYLIEPICKLQLVKGFITLGPQGEQLKTRVKKICEGFRATLYPCPDQVSVS